MKIKSTIPAEEDARYSTRLTLRLTPSEYAVIRQKADAFGCTLSQAVRKIVIAGCEKNERPDGDFKAENRSVSAAMRAVRDDFKRIAPMYAATVEAYRRSVGLTNRAGAPAVNTALTLRAVRELQDMTLDMQRSLNVALAAAGVKEIHAATRMELPEPPPVAGGLTKTEFIQYFYMESIELIGILAKDAGRYNGKNNEEKMALSINCVRRRKGASINVPYTAFAEMRGIFDHLKAGKQVYVRGTFTEDDNGRKVVFADTVKLLGEKEPEED